ncbi:phenylalanine--tRNA ligase subunit beta [Candidatus Woesearchaeota archaeon]|nr:phenylalanine--tRNA ligase subunit beta [Candidatus Woesearchaeota archaeon]
MPTVTLNKTVFEKLVGKKLPLDRLKDRISMLGTDLESIEDNQINVEIFPNRPDMLSEQGFSRAFSSFIGEKTGLRKYEVKKSGYKVIVDKSVAMRPYTVCAVVKNLKLDDEKIRELMQVQEKLATTHGRNRKKSEYGFYHLEKINFPVTYIAKDPTEISFKPLGFDEVMPALRVEEIHPKGKAYKWLADDWKKKGFNKYPFFIDGKNMIIAMLPYTNSNEAGKIDTTTANVFVEATGSDLSNISVALNILVTTLADMGGEIYSVAVEYPDKTIITPDLAPSKMKLDLPYINKSLGLSLSEKQAKELLERMGYGYEKGNVLIPAYRADILHQVDLVEDIAIAYGYEKFEELIPQVATIAEEDRFEQFKSKIADLLVGLGFFETSTHHLVPKEIQTTSMDAIQDVLSVVDPVSIEFNTLRAWMLPSLMQVLHINKHNEYPQHLFEMGTVFNKGSVSKHNQTGVIEEQHLVVVLCGERNDFTRIRQVLDYLFKLLELSYTTASVDHHSFIPGRVAGIKVGSTSLGFLGELKPSVIHNFSLEYPVVALEINLTSIFNSILSNIGSHHK